MHSSDSSYSRRIAQLQLWWSSETTYSMNSFEWRQYQGAGFLADVVAKSVLELERILPGNTTHASELQCVIDRLYSGVRESRALRPGLLTYANDLVIRRYPVVAPRAGAPAPDSDSFQHGASILRMDDLV
jgi:hypothetical protein